MDTGEDYSEIEEGQEPLVERLRNLRWPEVPAETRERCWREFHEMMAARGVGLRSEPAPGEP